MYVNDWMSKIGLSSSGQLKQNCLRLGSFTLMNKIQTESVFFWNTGNFLLPVNIENYMNKNP